MKISESRKLYSKDKNQPKFSQLFKFYKLKSGYKKFSQLALQLELRGFRYDLSLYSHWQRGSRVPKNRKLLLNLIEIFSDSGSMKFQEQADIFLQSADSDSLNKNEKAKLLKLQNNQNKDYLDLELERFLASEKTCEHSKHKLLNHPKRNFKFSFLISSDTFLYLEKAAEISCASKANFLRRLINDHKKLGSKTKTCM